MKSPPCSATLIAVNINRLILVLCIAVLAGGCKREEGVRVYNSPKDPPVIKFPVVHRGGMQSDMAENEGGGNIHYTPPPEWKQIAAPQMTNAAYQVSENPPVMLTVSQIAARGSEAESTLANLNRWEGQLSLPPTPAAGLDQIARPLKIAGHDARLIELSGVNAKSADHATEKMLAALIFDGEGAWAFKMTGAPQAVEPHKKAFADFIMSVHFDAAGGGESAGGTPAEAGPASAGKIPGIASYTLPGGFQIDPNQRPMRAATIIVNSGNQQGEIIVSQFPIASLNDLKANIDRWRGNVGLTPTDNLNSNPPQEMTLAQGPATLREFSGPESAGAARKRQFVIYTQFPGQPTTWFFRFVGPYELVSTNKPAFEAFVKSIKFEIQ